MRLIGYAEDADTFRDYVHQSHWAFLPSVGLAPGPDTRVACDFEKTGVAVPRNPALESLIAEVEAEIGRYGKLALVS
ncbi:hypothetical protein A8V01_15490 [Novosphingobium guangzhouense]|uniref:Uncharacterized protein n=1 Tax=Novosphingobium guangzhouense TaxID=1850347 RepID=A0A2K2G3K2_9SPHN|nr:hypothetical protein [Novosphingobium guangzhouense]PNU05568.1 hypothetical protein A8V01_15490 [Novosphingobium guangzhouense]